MGWGAGVLVGWVECKVDVGDGAGGRAGVRACGRACVRACVCVCCVVLSISMCTTLGCAVRLLCTTPQAPPLLPPPTPPTCKAAQCSKCPQTFHMGSSDGRYHF